MYVFNYSYILVLYCGDCKKLLGLRDVPSSCSCGQKRTGAKLLSLLLQERLSS